MRDDRRKQNSASSPDDQVDDLLDVNRAAHRAVKRVRGGGDIQPHQRRAADLINAARGTNYYSPGVFVGLLHEEGYARALMAPSSETMSLQPQVWTRFSANGNQCVEVMLTDAEVLVRNSNRPQAGTLSFTFAEWDSHTKGRKLGVFDLPVGTL